MFDYFRNYSSDPIMFAVKIVQLKVLVIHSRSGLHLKLDNCLTCTIIAISQTIYNGYDIQTCYDDRLMHGISV